MPQPNWRRDPVRRVSIAGRGPALGWTLALPEEETNLMSRVELMDRIAGLLGGRSAEEVVFQDVSSGAADDIEQATTLARQMVTRWGMSARVGPVAIGGPVSQALAGRFLAEQRARSEEEAAAVDEEIRAIFENAHATALRVLSGLHWVLETVAERLLETETVEGDELDRILRKSAAVMLPRVS